MKLKTFILLFIFFGLGSPVFGQVDTMIVELDSLKQDTAITKTDTSTNQPKGYKLSRDAVTSEIKYGAVDSNITLVKNKVITLYDKATVNYETFKIEADVVIIDFNANQAQGISPKDSMGNFLGRGNFDSGDTKGTFHRMTYNFETKKAFVVDLKTTEGEFNLLGGKSKFVSGESDSIYGEDRFFNESAIITTCNLDHPHFGIYTRKLKFIPDRLAVLGPAQLYIADVPTPLVLPFGFLPLIQGASSGLIFPQDYDYNPLYGFGLREVGYYFPINDYLDVKVTGDIYTRGSHAIRTASNYKKRYAYTGNVNLEYSNFLLEDQLGKINSQKSFAINIRHSQDSKAHPYRTIGGSVGIQSNNHAQRNYFDANSALNNIYRSSLSYNYRFPDAPFTLSAGMEHIQDTRDHSVIITVPSANLTMNTIQPFKRKNAIGDKKWFEDINLSYNAGFQNKLSTTDTTIFSPASLNDFSMAFTHSPTLAYNARILKYINVSPSINYTETYNLKRFEQYLDPNLKVDTNFIDKKENIFELDTTFGTVIDTLITDPNVYRNVGISTSFNTQLFFVKTKNTGWLRGFRHIVKPSATFTYNPGNKDRYQRSFQTDTRPEFSDTTFYNPFPNLPFSTPLSNEGLSLSWNFNNTIESKYYSKKDTTVKKMKIIENWSVNGSYDFFRDTMQWSNIALRGNSALLKGITTMDFRMILTPYVLKSGKFETNEYLWNNKKRPVQLKSIDIGFNSNIRISDIIDKLKGKDENVNPSAAPPTQNGQRGILEEMPSLGDLIEKFSVSHNYQIGLRQNKLGQDSLVISAHTLGINGNIVLTKNWTLGLGNISYDFQSDRLVYPSITVQRDLHCWAMNFGWYPSSKVYSFFIGAKSSSLNFLKYDYGQNNFGPGSRGF